MSKTVVLGIDAWYPQVDGVTNVVVSYRSELEQKDWNCKIVAPSYGRDSDAHGEEEYCGKVFHNRSLAVPFLSFRNSTPGTDIKLKKCLDELKPDILHAHSPFAICSYFVRYGKKHNIPVVFTFHTKFRDEFMRVTHSRLITFIMMKAIMRNVNKVKYVWAVSESSAKTLKEYGYKGEIKVMRNGTDMPVLSASELASLSSEIEKEYGISPDERILLYTGRVVSVKNLKFSFAVLAELKRRGFKCRFFVVGGGDELEAHKKIAEKMGLSDVVVFTGFIGDRNKLRAFYARANLFLLPSVFDNAPLVVIEAASCHTPSLVPAGSSAAEVISDGKTGYCERLEVPLWADRIEKIFSDSEYAELCEACTSVVYTWRDAVSDAEEEYRNIIADYASHSEK